VRTVLVADAVLTGRGSIGNAVAIQHGQVVAVGESREIVRDGDHVVVYDGGFLTPGFRDAHIHAIPYAALLTGCSLKSASSIADLIDRLATFARSQPPGAPIVASRFDDESLIERRLPTRADLDVAVPDRPAVIYRYCGHIAVANSRALADSGIEAATADPDGGIVDRSESGEPTGVLRETATGLIATSLARGGPLPASDLIDGLTRLGGLGITSIGAMIGYGESPHERLACESELFREVADDLPIRVHGLSIASTPTDLASSAATLTGGGDRLRWLGVKRFSDGSLGGHTAAMCSPFSDADTTGTYRLTADDIALSRQSLKLGGMVAIHAIGDRAISEVLGVFGVLLSEGASTRDLRMEHVSVASPQLITDFASTGAIAVIQPAFLASEEAWLAKRLGSERMEWAYPFRSMLRAGITLAGSSDSIVEPPHPLWGIAAAMDRHGIAPEESLSGLEALDVFTSGGAVALREMEPLAVGSPADVAVVDCDFRTATSDEVHDAHVLDTYVDGSQLRVDRSQPTWVD